MASVVLKGREARVREVVERRDAEHLQPLVRLVVRHGLGHQLATAKLAQLLGRKLVLRQVGKRRTRLLQHRVPALVRGQGAREQLAAA
eukprot:scaffold27403_cov62-Phaeocystis_antarctica.AAC.4